MSKMSRASRRGRWKEQWQIQYEATCAYCGAHRQVCYLFLLKESGRQICATCGASGGLEWVAVTDAA